MPEAPVPTAAVPKAPALTEEELTAILAPMEPAEEMQAEEAVEELSDPTAQAADQTATEEPVDVAEPAAEPTEVQAPLEEPAVDNPGEVQPMEDQTPRAEEIDLISEAAERLGEGYWSYDLRTGATQFSDRFKEILGYLPEELEDRFTTWLDLTDPEGQKTIRSVALENPRPFSILISLLKRDGMPAACVVRGWVEKALLRGTLLRIEKDRNGAPTDRKLLGQAIEGGVEAMLVLRAVRSVEGEPVDFEIVDLNAKGASLLGIPKAEALGRLLGDAAPAARETGAFERYAAVMESGTPQSQEFHASPGGFQQIWLSQRIVPLEDGVAVFTSDVSEARRAGDASDRSRRMFERITVSTPDLHAIWDLQTRRFVYANRTLFEMLGYEEQTGSMVHLSALERLLLPADLNSFHQHLRLLAEEQTDRFIEAEFRFRASDGSFRWLLFRDAVFDRFADQRPKTVLCTAQDVSRQKRSEVELQSQNAELEKAREQLHLRQKQLEDANSRLGDLAMTDPVTGLKNRRAYQERLDEEVERAQRYKLRLALLLADIDRFKLYNDRYGHPEGDRALKGFGKVLTEVSRLSDTVARFGGEEFCIILPNTGAEEAARLAERIQASLKGTEFGMRGVTASFGCAEVGPGKDAKERIVADADRALYQSKNEGRDRISVIRS